MPPSKRKAEDSQAHQRKAAEDIKAHQRKKAEEHRKGRLVLEAEQLKKARYAAAQAATAAVANEKAQRKKAEEHRKGRQVLEAEKLKKARYAAAKAATTATTSSGSTAPSSSTTAANTSQRNNIAARATSQLQPRSRQSSSSSRSRSIANVVTPTNCTQTAKQRAPQGKTAVVWDSVPSRSSTSKKATQSVDNYRYCYDKEEDDHDMQDGGETMDVQGYCDDALDVQEDEVKPRKRRRGCSP
jgi:electron transfer flavoprotein alpha subunit